MTSQEFIEAVRQQHASLKKIWTWPPFVEASPPHLGMTRILWVIFASVSSAGHLEVRGLFARYLEHQETAFERMLHEILDYLKDGAWLQLHLFALGTRHTNLYKVPADANVPENLSAFRSAWVAGWGDGAIARRPISARA